MNKFFKTLAEKPWEESQAKIDNEHQGKTLSLSKYKLGLRTIMVVSTIIFSFLSLLMQTECLFMIGEVCQNHGCFGPILEFLY